MGPLPPSSGSQRPREASLLLTKNGTLGKKKKSLNVFHCVQRLNTAHQRANYCVTVFNQNLPALEQIVRNLV